MAAPLGRGTTWVMEAFVAFALVFATVQAATYIVCERGNRSAWVRDVAYVHAEAAPGASFRGTEPAAHAYVGPQLRPRAPLHVRAVALWSIGMGQMLIPGALAAAGGTIMYGIGLVGIPGCMLAARIWGLGPALLRAEPTAVQRARETARFAILLNAVVLVVAVLVGLDPQAWGLGVFIGAYGLVSVAHAIALRRVADTVEALWVARGYDAEQLPRRRHTAPAAPNVAA